MSAPSHPRADTEPGQRPVRLAGSVESAQSADSTGSADSAPDALHAAVRAHRVREARREREGEGSLARDLALVGVLGWTIVVPVLLGLFGGRWLDRRWGTGIFWTGALLALGLGVGCLLAWRRVRGS